MSITSEKMKEYSRRLILSRMRILSKNGFYGLLLMHMKFQIREGIKTAATNGDYIMFDPDFMDELSDDELDFIMMHEILHVALQHCYRGQDYNKKIFNIACDIVVNSNIKLSCGNNELAISLYNYGVSIHLAPDGNEGFNFSAEEVYKMLMNMRPGKEGSEYNDSGETSDENHGNKGSGSGDYDNGDHGQLIDNHELWEEASKDKKSREIWESRCRQAYEAVGGRASGKLPRCMERMFKELSASRLDWRTILNDFIQEEICDYSFNPPDRRFWDSPFFLPDFNECQDKVEKILFMIDSSASMSDEMITEAFSEINGALEQFNGHLEGWLGFFDAEVVEPVAFSNVDELKIIKPFGGGGTSFKVVFEYVNVNMEEDLPASIVILTDGLAEFPKESIARGIPVLWMINNRVIDPPWGRVARLEEKR